MAQETSIGSMTEDIKKSISEIASLDAYKYAFSALGQQATDLNKTFTQNRQRIVEMQQSIADAIPGIRRLGGGIEDVTKLLVKLLKLVIEMLLLIRNQLKNFMQHQKF